VSTFDPTYLAAIRRELEDLDDLWQRREAALRAPMVADSLASIDDALPDARFVSIYAGQSSADALDDLTTWRTLANGPLIPMRAHLTLLRGALEAADRCRWHVDATVDAGTRVGRGMAGRRDDQDERRRFEESKEHDPPLPRPPRGMTAVERLAALDDPNAIAKREAAGVRTVGYTDTTSLMRAYGHERWFRLSSGLAHGKEWALAAGHLDRSTDPPLREKVGHGSFSASEPVALALTQVAMAAVRTAVEDLESYVGLRACGSSSSSQEGAGMAQTTE
jgi:hypothetical protein